MYVLRYLYQFFLQPNDLNQIVVVDFILIRKSDSAKRNSGDSVQPVLLCHQRTWGPVFNVVGGLIH